MPGLPFGDDTDDSVEALTESREYVRVRPSTEGTTTEIPLGLTRQLYSFLQSTESGSLFGSSPDPHTLEVLITSAAGEQGPIHCLFGVDDPDKRDELAAIVRRLYPDGYRVDSLEASLANLLDLTLATDETDDEPTIATPADAATPNPNDQDPDRDQTQDPTHNHDQDPTCPPVAGLELAAREKSSKAWMYTFPTPDAQGSDDHTSDHLPLVGAIQQLATTATPVALQLLVRPKPDWTADKRALIKGIEAGETSFVESVIRDVIPAGEGDISDSKTRRIENLRDKRAEKSFTINVRGVAFDTDDALAPADTLASLGDHFGALDSEYREIAARQYDPDQRGARTILDRFCSRQVHTTAGRGARAKSWTFGPATRPYLVADIEELWLFVGLDSQAFPEAATRATRTLTDDRPDVTLPDPDKLSHFDSGMPLGTALDGDGRPQTDIELPAELQQLHSMIIGGSGSGKSMLATRAMVKNVAATDGPTILLDPKGDGLVEAYKRAHYQEFGTLEDVVHLDFSRGVPNLTFLDVRNALAAGIPREHAVETRIDHFEDVLRALNGDSYDDAVRSPDVIRLLVKTCFDPKYGEDAVALGDLYDVGEQLQAGEVPLASDTLTHQLLSITESPPDTRSKIMGGVFSRLDELSLDDRLKHLFDHVTHDPSAGFDLETFLEDDGVVILDMGDLQPQPRKAFSLVVLSELWFALQRRTRKETTETTRNREAPTETATDRETDTETDSDSDSNSDSETVAGATTSSIADPDFDTNIIDPRSTETTNGSQSDADPPRVNLFLEEAPSLANSDLLAELVAQGREFGLAITLLAQYPQQFQERSDTRDQSRLYGELVNDISTVVAGTVNHDPRLGHRLSRLDPDRETAADRLRGLDRGQWIAALPAPFGNERPRPFLVQSPPLPPGHPEGPEPLTGDAEVRYRSADRTMQNHVAEEYLRPYPSLQADAENEGTFTRTLASEDDNDQTASSSLVPATDSDGSDPNAADSDGSDPNAAEPNEADPTPSDAAPETDAATADDDRTPPSEADTHPPADPTGGFDLSDDPADADAGIPPDDIQGGHVPREEALPMGVHYHPKAEAYSCRSCITSESDTPTRYPATAKGLRRALTCCRDPTDIDRAAIRQIPIPSLQLTPGEIEASTYSLAQLRYLKALYTALTDGYDSFTEFDIVEDSMRTLRQDLELPAAAIEELAEDNLIQKDTYPHTVVGLRPDGRKTIQEPWHYDHEFGHGVGDLDESGQHRLMIEAARRFLCDHADIVDYDDEVVTYFERPNGDRLDLAVIDSDDDITIALEAERQNNDPIESTIATYTKLSQLDLEEAIWLVPTEEEAHEIIEILAREGANPKRPVEYDGPNYSEGTRVAHFDLDEPGITDMYTIRQLMSTIDPPWAGGPS